MSVRDYDSTPSNNTTISSIDISEGCSPAGINNAIRQQMADIKDVSVGTVALESPKFDGILDGNIKATDASGTDAAGTATTIKGGAGTGTGAGGSIVFQVADADASTGSSVNAHATAMTIADSGKVTVGPADSGATASATDADDFVIDNAADGGMSILSANTAIGAIRFIDSDGTAGAVRYDHSDDSLKFVTSNNIEMNIKSNGVVQVGNAVGDGSSLHTFQCGGSGVFTSILRVVGDLDDNPNQNSSSSADGMELNPNGVIALIANSTYPLRVCRTGTDGTVAGFFAQGNLEGTISISGTTTSYNGGHLSRWSQLTDNSRDLAIVKGTVLTNLDQMAEWTNEGVTEDNEQLNCMAVSSIEGDPNVAGVFVNWDDDDDTYHNDMNVAMTGDMVIRVAQGTTVARGDLLMSAGDGTAKPQGDDIVRSKTIAKVTSTHVSHTYDDGSYLVPCVLMAC